jgi:exopolysaccharide biosynthesis polyprenyl glycosylphosphotransferase
VLASASAAADVPAVRTPSSLRLRLIGADLAALLAGFAFAFAAQSLLNPVAGSIVVEHVVFALASIPGFALGAAVSRLHLSRANERPGEEFRHIAQTVTIGLATLLALAFLAQYSNLSRLWVVLAAGGVTVAAVVERQIARRAFQNMKRDGRLQRPILIVGTDTHAISLMHRYQRHPELGYHVVGLVGSDPHAERADMQVLGGIDDVSRVVSATGAVGVVISLHSVSADDVNSLTRTLTDARCHVALSSSLCDIDISRLRPQQLDGYTLFYVEQVVRTGWRSQVKRVFDVSLAATILLLSAPLLAVAALAIRLTSPGPILFRQTRVGRNGELFKILKLRTMTADAEQRRSALEALNEVDGPLFKMASDPRVTPAGRWLRKLSIDELPQLICVLRGKMSMVGPRPALPDEVARWDPEVRQRLRVLPGLTGLWQVSGRSDSSFEQYKRLDLYYVDNWSISHDLRICAKTVGVVLTGRGAA